jgi:hypothetical protein
MRQSGSGVMALYGLIDTARDQRLFDLFAGAERECLFAGKLDPQLERVSPHIVRIYEGSPLMHTWQREGWGESWGILCSAPVPLKDVRRFFRHFLRVRLPDKRLMLFRFYDPRVWRIYAATCTPSQIAEWFTVVDEYRAESEDGMNTLRYRFDRGALDVATMR